MNTGYLIYQAERTITTAEQREFDRRNGELAAAVSRRWQALAGALRFRGHGFAAAPPARQAGGCDDFRCTAGSTV
jgi:hypothetical protein